MQEGVVGQQHVLDIPVGPLGIVGMRGCEELTARVDDYVSSWRADRHAKLGVEVDILGYYKDSYQLTVSCPRFSSGESKGMLHESTRGRDLYIICDCFNYSIQYRMYGMETHMSPDDHFQDLKRVIAAIGSKARRINVIMPMLYEGRQHKRMARESLDCAIMLQELIEIGVENIITFDAHDPRVVNAIPFSSLENIKPTYQFLKALINNVPDIKINKDHLMIISPDEGGMDRSIYYATMLGVDIGMFYKRRDYTRIVNGRNPIVAHEFLGDSVAGKDLVIVDDVISSGDSMLDIAAELKSRGARRIFMCATFGLFTEGLEAFDQAHQTGVFDKVLSTNLTYRTPDLMSRPWYASVDMSKYIAYIIEHLNHDKSLSDLIDPSDRIRALMDRYRSKFDSGQIAWPKDLVKNAD